MSGELILELLPCASPCRAVPPFRAARCYFLSKPSLRFKLAFGPRAQPNTTQRPTQLLPTRTPPPPLLSLPRGSTWTPGKDSLSVAPQRAGELKHGASAPEHYDLSAKPQQPPRGSNMAALASLPVEMLRRTLTALLQKSLEKIFLHPRSFTLRLRS